MVLTYGRQRLRGTAALHGSSDHHCYERRVIAGRSVGVFQGANEHPYLNHTGRKSNAVAGPF
jgi:hypothetical protein